VIILDYLRAVSRGSSAYWERRARRHGRRSVLNIAHEDAEYEQITSWQKSILFPLLQAQLNGSERVVLDFGCGPGRFTPGLARLVGGRAIGVDPIGALLELAPADPRVEYRLLRHGRIRVTDHSVDLLWICLVLGVIRGRKLHDTLQELRRVVAPGGLVFLVENTTAKPSRKQIEYRSVAEYTKLVDFAQLQHLHDYEDLGETISVLAGRVP
jgi:ubiquinone/menaquinone biosynthesis C-methylase UbiE